MSDVDQKKNLFAAGILEIERADAKQRLLASGWRLMEWDESISLSDGLGTRYNLKSIVPLLRRDDSDDIVCMDGGSPGGLTRVIEIHDFAQRGWERGRTLPFIEWIQSVSNISR
jgi:hypothetical protein